MSELFPIEAVYKPIEVIEQAVEQLGVAEIREHLESYNWLWGPYLCDEELKQITYGDSCVPTQGYIAYMVLESLGFEPIPKKSPASYDLTHFRGVSGQEVKSSAGLHVFVKNDKLHVWFGPTREFLIKKGKDKNWLQALDRRDDDRFGIIPGNKLDVALYGLFAKNQERRMDSYLQTRGIYDFFVGPQRYVLYKEKHKASEKLIVTQLVGNLVIEDLSHLLENSALDI